MQTKARISKDLYKCWTEVTLRYGDTDALGHVNNAVFATMLEQGRATLLFDGVDSISEPGSTFVLASIKLDFLSELHFPGIVEVGTRVVSFGRTSIKLEQAIFKDGACCALSEDIVVLIDLTSRRPIPLSEQLREAISSRAANCRRK
jgi:acyl-CoA thioester hydrolase